MTRRAFGALLPLLLVACGETGREPDAAPPTETQAPPAGAAAEAEISSGTRVTAAASLGSFESRVTDLASWEAPDLGFQSLVYAANGEAGITVVQADGQNAQVIETEATPFKLAVVYALHEGGALLSLSREGRLEILSPDGRERLSDQKLTEAPVRAMCAGDFGSTSQLVAVLEDGTTRPFEFFGLEPVPVQSVAPGPEGVTDCAFLKSRVAYRTSEGWTTGDGTRAEGDALVMAEGRSPVALDVSPSGLRYEGTSLTLESSDGEAVRPQMVRAAPGNLGGILRDGALIVLDERRGLHLYPWSGVANRLGLPRSLESRRQDPELQRSGFEVKGDLETLKPRQELPGFEERETPEPPTR